MDGVRVEQNEAEVERLRGKIYDEHASRYQKARIAHWDRIAQQLSSRRRGAFYHKLLEHYYRLLIPSGMHVLEIGCGRGDLLAAVKPSAGVGVDFSAEMLAKAKQAHPELIFHLFDAHSFSLDQKFDVIILSDLLNDVWDVQTVLEQIAHVSSASTRIIINCYSSLWELPLAIAERFKLANPNLLQNWLTVEDIANLLHLTGFEVVRSWSEICWPLRIPLIDGLFNRFLSKLWPFSLFNLTNFIVARRVKPLSVNRKPRVSVVIPARNESGNIEQIMTRTPEMGSGTELIFVEGHSKDNTYAVIQSCIANHPERCCKLLRQTGIGKGDAVRAGFAVAEGDILMILDADLTVPPEDLPRFFDILNLGEGEFANGVRLVYPMEDQAMQFLNKVGNKFFSLAFSWLLDQPIKDTLCGTKVLWKSDYDHIIANRAYFGNFDPFGDFDLLFGAAKLNLKIVDLPIRYRARTYGTTNINRWKHGWLLLRMVLFAALKIKFV